jgi:hypothetical protein
MNKPDVNEIELRALVLAVYTRAPDDPLPEPVVADLRRVMEDPALCAGFQAELVACMADATFHEATRPWVDLDAELDHCADQEVAELIRNRADADSLLRALGADSFDLRAEVDRRREASLLGRSDTIVLRKGRVAPLRLQDLGSAWIEAAFRPARILADALGRAFRSLVLPPLVPDGVVLASGGPPVPVLAVDPATKTLVTIPTVVPPAVDSLRLDPVPARTSWHVIKGEPEVLLDARDLPEGSFPGGVLLVVFPLRSGDAAIRLSVGGKLRVLEVEGAEASDSRIRIRASIEEAFQGQSADSPRLDRSGLKLVLLPQEISGPWSDEG